MRIYEMITWENTLIIIKFVYWSVWKIVCENLWKWSPKWNTLSFYQILPTNSLRNVLWSVWRICLRIFMKWSLKWNTLICYQILSTKECTVVTLENLYVSIVTWRVKDSKKKLQLNEVLEKGCKELLPYSPYISGVAWEIKERIKFHKRSRVLTISSLA